MNLCEFYNITPTQMFYGVDESKLPIDYWDDFSTLARILEKKAKSLQDLNLYLELNSMQKNGVELVTNNIISDEKIDELKLNIQEMFEEIEKIRRRIIELLDKQWRMETFIRKWY